MHFFRKGEKLDKAYIIERMKGNPTYADYTPDVSDAKKFSKDFLLLLIAYVDPQLYRELYSINKRQLQDRIYNKLGDYQIDISKDLLKDIEDFIPSNSQANAKGGFRGQKILFHVEHFTKLGILMNKINKKLKIFKSLKMKKIFLNRRLWNWIN